MIASNRPILILDEPQKMEGAATMEALPKFKPLFIMRYSATHRTQHNRVHRLDALDAYNQKLVKKIAVRGIQTRGLAGTNAYLYLEGIEISKTQSLAERRQRPRPSRSRGPRRTAAVMKTVPKSSGESSISVPPRRAPPPSKCLGWFPKNTIKYSGLQKVHQIGAVNRFRESGPERTQFGPLAPSAVNCPSPITLGNKGKF